MIDFRYHLVSIIAIFLALALGIVVGTTALNGKLLDDLRSNVGNLTGEKRALETDVRALRDRVGDDDAFVASVTGGLVQEVLAQDRVLLVLAPGTPTSYADDLVPVVEQAGASVVGQLQVKPALLDPARTGEVDDLVAKVLPAGVDVPSDGTALDRAAVELAAALVRKSAGGDGISDAAAEEVVGGFTALDLVDLDRPDGPARRANLVVLLTGPAGDPPVDAADKAALDGLLVLAGTFDDRADGALVAGPLTAVDEGGAVKALRDDAGLDERVSSVDVVDSPMGRVLTVLALREQKRGQAGRYGGGSRAGAAVPSAPPP